MNDVIDAAKHIGKVLRIGDVGCNDFRIVAEGLQILAFSRGKVIDDFDGLVAPQQLLDDVRTNEAATACYDICRHREPPVMLSRLDAAGSPSPRPEGGHRPRE